MSIGTISGYETSGPRFHAVMFCSTSGIAFGPLLGTTAEAVAFQKWLGVDARNIPSPDWNRLLVDFRAEKPAMTLADHERFAAERTDL